MTLLNREYWSFRGDGDTEIDRIEAEFKSVGLVIHKKCSCGDSFITINKRGQKILFELLKKRFRVKG
jgi:hypothetical protein